MRAWALKVAEQSPRQRGKLAVTADRGSAQEAKAQCAGSRTAAEPLASREGRRGAQGDDARLGHPAPEPERKPRAELRRVRDGARPALVLVGHCVRMRLRA